MVMCRCYCFRRFPGLFVITGLLLLSSCDAFFNEPVKTNSLALTEGQFYAYSWVTKSYYICNTTLLAVGDHCLVYGEKDGKTQPGITLDAALGKEIAAEFDNKIYTKMIGSFGQPLDVDGNGKVILLLLDIQDGYDQKTSFAHTAGYFDGSDMEQGAYSNKADMLYIDTWPVIPGSADSYTTVAHEFQHLINYSTHRGVGKPVMDTWIDEGLSTAAEYLYGGSQPSRINWYGDDRNTSIRYGNNFFVWNGYWESPNPIASADLLTNYTTAYLFFQWLRIHAGNGEGIYRDIINSPYSDYRAVTSAASKWIDPRFDDWATLLSTWYKANHLCEPTGGYGYNEEISLGKFYVPSTRPSVWLYPGEGVYSKAPPSPFSATGKIKYEEIDTGDLLTYNANPNNSKSQLPEIGYIRSAIETASRSARSVLSAESSQPVPELYQWDGARYFLEKRDRENP